MYRTQFTLNLWRARRILSGKVIAPVLVAFTVAITWSTWRAIQRAKLGPPLVEAVTNQDMPRVRNLLNKGADPNTHLDAGQRRSAGLKDIVEVFRNFFQGGRKSSATMSVLSVAVFSGEDMVQALLDAGADPNAEGGDPKVKILIPLRPKTPLHWAVMLHRVKVVERLLKAGADPNKPDDTDMPPLILAVKVIVNLLALEHDDPIKEPEMVLLGWIQESNPGTYSDTRNASIVSDYEGIVIALLEHGAKPERQDRKGKSAIDYARQTKHNARLLKILQNKRSME
jgi:ankyrin repeat protein